jgi:hypothetical protein
LSAANDFFLKYDFKVPVSGNVMKQNELPLYNGCQRKDETGKKDFAAKFPPEDGNFLCGQDHDGRCTGQQILYHEECAATFLQIVGHDGIQLFGSRAHQVKREVGVDDEKSDGAEGSGKKTWAMRVTKGKMSHHARPC